MWRAVKECVRSISFVFLLQLFMIQVESRRIRSASGNDDVIINSVDYIWSMTTVAVGDTAVMHCSFDALFHQLRTGNIDWLKEPPSTAADDASAAVIATGRTMVIDDRRYRVYRPHNSALSVLIIRRARKSDAGTYRCNLSGSSTRHKYMTLNVTDSKIEAHTSPAKTRVKVDSEVTLWCNASGYPMPVVYWTREDRHRRLPDGSYQYWGNGLHLKAATEQDTGVYVCYLDNFVQPVVTYKFTLFVSDTPWRVEAFKMRFDSVHWYPQSSRDVTPIKNKSFLLMCETHGSPKPPPTIEWYHEGVPVSSGKNYYIIHDSTEWRNSFVSSTMVIMKYDTKFQGRYVCVASNGFRMKKQTFYIKDADNATTSVAPITTSGLTTRSPKPALQNKIPVKSNQGSEGHVPGDVRTMMSSLRGVDLRRNHTTTNKPVTTTVSSTKPVTVRKIMTSSRDVISGTHVVPDPRNKLPTIAIVVRKESVLVKPESVGGGAVVSGHVTPKGTDNPRDDGAGDDEDMTDGSGVRN